MSGPAASSSTGHLGAVDKQQANGDEQEHKQLERPLSAELTDLRPLERAVDDDLPTVVDFDRATVTSPHDLHRFLAPYVHRPQAMFLVVWCGTFRVGGQKDEEHVSTDLQSFRSALRQRRTGWTRFIRVIRLHQEIDRKPHFHYHVDEDPVGAQRFTSSPFALKKLVVQKFLGGDPQYMRSVGVRILDWLEKEIPHLSYYSCEQVTVEPPRVFWADSVWLRCARSIVSKALAVLTVIGGCFYCVGHCCCTDQVSLDLKYKINLEVDQLVERVASSIQKAKGDERFFEDGGRFDIDEFLRNSNGTRSVISCRHGKVTRGVTLRGDQLRVEEKEDTPESTPDDGSPAPIMRRKRSGSFDGSDAGNGVNMNGLHGTVD